MLEKRKVEKSEKYNPVRASQYLGTKKGDLYLQPKEGGEVRETKNGELKGEIFYIVPTKNHHFGFHVKSIMISDYDIPQLDRIEKKMDKILELLEDK
ncbi:hypothetical protein MKY30_23815 [Oceanobacillus sp. FSL W8-0428]|uniref:hypothetical protein n=1 Tax=Oceanobacillus sp. FSL W8-0428 TaxID=2921715 RepID=UPI0030FAF783